MSTTATETRTAETVLFEHIRDMVDSCHGLTDIQEADGAINAVAEGVADALLSADGAAIAAAASALLVAAGAWQQRNPQDGAEALAWAEERGRLYGIVDILRWVLERRSQHASAGFVEPGSHAHRMLTLLSDADSAASALNSGAIAQLLDVDKTQVSRTGRDLIGRGLAATTSLGRKIFWEITPRGQYALEQLNAATPTSCTSDPVALSLGDVTDARAEEVANTLATRHDDVTAVVVSGRAAEAPASSGSRRQPVPVMLIQAPCREVAQLQALAREVAAELGTAPLPLSVVRASDDGRVVTVLSPTASSARERRMRRGRAIRTSTS